MQRFLGMAVFFNEFVPNFSEVTVKLYDMVTPSFDWDQKTWKEDYRDSFEKVKEALCESQAKHFPDYNLVWVLRTDASDFAVASTLLQLRIEGDKVSYEVIGFKAQKLTGAARRWDTFKKEAYGVYYGVKSFAYYLRGKAFIIETDCRNLVWIEKSEVPIVIRWRVYLQSFQFLLRHIKGKDNVVADWASRKQEYEPAKNSLESKDDVDSDQDIDFNLTFLSLLGNEGEDAGRTTGGYGRQTL